MTADNSSPKSAASSAATQAPRRSVRTARGTAAKEDMSNASEPTKDKDTAIPAGTAHVDVSTATKTATRSGAGSAVTNERSTEGHVDGTPTEAINTAVAATAANPVINNSNQTTAHVHVGGHATETTMPIIDGNPFTKEGSAVARVDNAPAAMPVFRPAHLDVTPQTNRTVVTSTTARVDITPAPTTEPVTKNGTTTARVDVAPTTPVPAAMPAATKDTSTTAHVDNSGMHGANSVSREDSVLAVDTAPIPTMSAPMTVNGNPTAHVDVAAIPPPTIVGPTTPPSFLAGPFVDDAAISAAFSASGPAASQLATKLADVRTVAATRDYYLARGMTILQGVTWIKASGGTNIVVDRHSGIAMVEAQAAHAAQPEVNLPPPIPDPAQLYIIGNIASESCFMKCDGNVGINPTPKFQRTLANNTMVCALVQPPDDYPFLVDEYKHGVKTLKSIIAGDVKAEPSKWDGFNFKDLKDEHVRLRHRVYRLKADGDPHTDHLPDMYRAASWPVNQAAEAERDRLVQTHYAHPLPAFDVTGELMPPTQYVDLSGATVLVGFSVTHFTFTGKNTVCLDITYLRVLIPGSARYRSSAKRTAIQMTDPLSHASGKRRAA